MHPILFKIGWFELHPYGIMLVIAVITGILLGLKRAKNAGIDQNLVLDLVIVVSLLGIVGSRTMYVIFHLEEFRGHYVDIFNPIQSNGTVGIYGMTILGGVIFGLLSGWFYLKYKKAVVLLIFNTLAPSVALGYAIARIGCFFQGCCFGVETSQPWGMIFPENSAAGYVFPNQPIHPAQLYAFFGGLINFLLLLVLERYSFFKNKVFFLFLVFYGISRFVEDIFRYYEESMILFHVNSFALSVNQGISIAFIIIGLSGIFYIGMKK